MAAAIHECDRDHVNYRDIYYAHKTIRNSLKLKQWGCRRTIIMQFLPFFNVIFFFHHPLISVT